MNALIDIIGCLYIGLAGAGLTVVVQDRRPSEVGYFKALFALSALFLLGASMAFGAEIESTVTLDNGRAQNAIPMIRNDSDEPVTVRPRIGGASFGTITIPPRSTAAPVLDTGFMRGRGRYEIELEEVD